VVREAKQVIEDHNARLILLGTPDQFGAAVPDGMTVVPISCQSEGALEVYIEPVLPVPHLVVVGSSPMAQTLAGLGRTLGWNTDLIDGPHFTVDHVGPRSMVIVATQGHDDEDITQRAIAAHPAYLGLVASKKRGEAVLGYLADSGVPLPELERVQAPAGLDLGRTSHEEMAVAVLAQLVQMRAAGAFDRQIQPPHPERVELNMVEPLSAVDPVCGMTVDADSSAHPFTHDGTTYYFCSSGCRRSFEKDPGAYLKKEAIH
jgi:xanthine dehydrogenase accessory factor